MVVTGECVHGACTYPSGQCTPWSWLDDTAVRRRTQCSHRLARDEVDMGCGRVYARMHSTQLIPVVSVCTCRLVYSHMYLQGTTVQSVCYYLSLTLLTHNFTQYTTYCTLLAMEPRALIQVDLVRIHSHLL
jgi:hypothetical protein